MQFTRVYYSTTTAFFLAAFLAVQVASDHEGSSDPLDWLRAAVPGEPGVDYPIYADVGITSFTCANKIFGGKLSLYCIYVGPTLLQRYFRIN